VKTETGRTGLQGVEMSDTTEDESSSGDGYLILKINAGIDLSITASRFYFCKKKQET